MHIQYSLDPVTRIILILSSFTKRKYVRKEQKKLNPGDFLFSREKQRTLVLSHPSLPLKPPRKSRTGSSSLSQPVDWDYESCFFVTREREREASERKEKEKKEFSLMQIEWKVSFHSY